MTTNGKKTFGFVMLLLLGIATAFGVSACDLCQDITCTGTASDKL